MKGFLLSLKKLGYNYIMVEAKQFGQNYSTWEYISKDNTTWSPIANIISDNGLKLEYNTRLKIDEIINSIEK